MMPPGGGSGERAVPGTARCAVHWAPARDGALDGALLDADERGRYERLRQPEDRARFATGRALARAVLAPLLGLEPADVRFATDCPLCGAPHGKPYVPGAAERFSLSHSGSWVVLAVTRTWSGARTGPGGRSPQPRTGAPWTPDIGVDVQRVVPRPGRTAPLVLSAREQAWLDGCPEDERARHFTRCWARKEAVLKATGHGVTAPMRSLEVSAPDQPAALLDGSPRWTGLTAGLADLRCPEPGYAAAVAVVGATAVRLWRTRRPTPSADTRQPWTRAFSARVRPSRPGPALCQDSDPA
jgi:4'-phosphopantetheinyl transferase